MIDMFLKPFSLQDTYKLFPGQLYLQWFLIVVAFVSVPMMLLPKPFLLRRDHNKGYKAIPAHEGEEGNVLCAVPTCYLCFNSIFII